MIHPQALLKDLKTLLARTLEPDIRERLEENPPLKQGLADEWQAARDAGRSAETLHDFIEEAVTQAAVHWLLMGVFIRFLEDNGLIDRPYLSGATPERRALALDRYEGYFRANPAHSDRDYLSHAYHEVAALPGMAELFDEDHNPLWRLPLSGDGGKAIVDFWRRLDPDSGRPVHDFTDGDWNTRFLGDLYQDLSEAAQKRFALLQTPEFVEAFILDRTLEPAVREFGYREVRLIDPTCGSGHFLLGAFHRLLDHWTRHEPGRNGADLAQRALDGVHGVDLNPFAVAIARFRLLIAALQAAGVARLIDAPNFKLHLAAGDSLLHGPRLGHGQLALDGEAENLAGGALGHAYQAEDLRALNRILGQRYHAVVGNPPYITVKDAALNSAYRARYPTCHMKYSLGVPFTERFFQLALPPQRGAEGAGRVGMITANSFMKREFGKKLIEEHLPRLDLTHVIDTSGAYIPGHGTPTVILFGRNRPPVASSVRTVMGIKGEPATPADPAQGLVWSAIVGQVDLAGSESAFVSVADTPRVIFAKHPWSIGGGGVSELKELIEENGAFKIRDRTDSIGFMAITGEDDAFVVPPHLAKKISYSVRPFVIGDTVRDWSNSHRDKILFPYVIANGSFSALGIDLCSHYAFFVWRSRTHLKSRSMFGKTIEEHGFRFDQFIQFISERVAASFLIPFSFVATHNHFILDRGGKVFNRSAPVIKLPEGATEDDHLALLGLLNSSVACFWLKQVCHNKGSTVDQHGARQTTVPFEDFYEFTGTKLNEFPLANEPPSDIARTLDQLAQELAALSPSALVDRQLPDRAELDAARARAESIRRRMIALQEELDWRCYRLYGLTEQELTCPAPPEIDLGERAFEIVLARRLAAGQEETTWFERHRARPVTEPPAHWPEEYRRLVEARIALIESDRSIGLVERPEYKRRWATEPWETRERAALREWLLDRLEQPRHWPEPPALVSVNRLADRVRGDAEFMRVAALYAGRADFQVPPLVAELVEAESAPLLPVLRYSESGLRKRAAWEETWAKQRQEDAIDAEVAAEWSPEPGEEPAAFARRLAAEQKRRKEERVGNIPVPPKYRSVDFASPPCWRLRGGLDVPKERFVSFPHCARDADGSLPVVWAGWDALQQAIALAAYFQEMRENEGWEAARLTPLLAAIRELLPWLKQWHNELDPEYGARMGDYLAGFVEDEAKALGLTEADLIGWRPPMEKGRRGRKRAG